MSTKIPKSDTADDPSNPTSNITSDSTVTTQTKNSPVEGRVPSHAKDPTKTASPNTFPCLVNDPFSESGKGKDEGIIRPNPAQISPNPVAQTPYPKSYGDAISQERVDDVQFGSLDLCGTTPTAIFSKEECNVVSDYYKFALIGF
ncbi:hypothetical protein OROMI_004813 [Orobanche minor]